MTEAEIQAKVRTLVTTDGPTLLAASFIVERAAYWLHPSRKWVRAPKHTERIVNGSMGYMISFGANSFLVGRAISRCAAEISAYYRSGDGTLSRHKMLQSDLSLQVRGSVANYQGHEYPGFYPIEHEMMVFGTQGILVTEVINSLLMMTATYEP